MNKRIAKDQDKQKELMLFLGVVWRRWSFFAIVSGLVVAVAASAVAIKTFKPQYEAKLYFQIIQNLDWIELAQGLGGKQNAANVLSLFQSEVICNRVVVDPQVLEGSRSETARRQSQIASTACFDRFRRQGE